ncbi:MAG: type II toxin-antitoxin system HicA family toxin [Spirochaetaceae bacterium]|nr:type II toxin-antitoxin system HicA family toxin [Spirochaetaceae bacterium]
MLYIATTTAREVSVELEAYGWVLDRINGSHHVFIKAVRRPVSVPFR